MAESETDKMLEISFVGSKRESSLLKELGHYTAILTSRLVNGEV